MITVKLPPAYDVSHWKIVPDFALVNPRPVLVLTKATEHVSYVDNTFIRYFADMKQDGVRRGVYHFFRKFYSATEQARHFCGVIRPYVDDSDILVLDFEEGGETASQLIAFLTYVKGQFPRNLIMVYGRKNLMDPIPMTEMQKQILKAYPVWVAGYPTIPDNYSVVPGFYVPDQSRWGPVWLWQYTEKGAVEGISGDVDCNWIHTDLLAWLGKPLEQPEEPMSRYTITTPPLGARLRPNHDTNNTAYGTIPGGVTLHTDIPLFTATVATTYQSVGDVWANVTYSFGGPDFYGWIAIVHLGAPVCTLTDNGAGEPEPVEMKPSRVLLEFPDGVQKWYVAE